MWDAGKESLLTAPKIVFFRNGVHHMEQRTGENKIYDEVPCALLYDCS